MKIKQKVVSMALIALLVCMVIMPGINAITQNAEVETNGEIEKEKNTNIGTGIIRGRCVMYLEPEPIWDVSPLPGVLVQADGYDVSDRSGLLGGFKLKNLPLNNEYRITGDFWGFPTSVEHVTLTKEDPIAIVTLFFELEDWWPWVKPVTKTRALPNIFRNNALFRALTLLKLINM